MPELVRPDGCRLAYETHGTPDSDPLLLVEGAGGDLPGWSRNIPALSAECFVIAYDQRGNGRSDAPDEPQTMATFVDDALGLLDHLGLERAHVYGQSFGGMVALELAMVAPSRATTLIAASTHAGGDSVVRVRERVPKGAADLAIFSESYAATDPAGVRALFSQGIPQQPHAARRQWEAMQTFDASERLGAIAAPTLVLHGTVDRVIGVENALLLADRIPGAELVLLEGAGHVYHWEQPAAADAAVLDFVRRHPG
ncbi:MAG: alpha/beta fold hydrolase [Actinomycetota bacterium]